MVIRQSPPKIQKKRKRPDLMLWNWTFEAVALMKTTHTQRLAPRPVLLLSLYRKEQMTHAIRRQCTRRDIYMADLTCAARFPLRTTIRNLHSGLPFTTCVRVNQPSTVPSAALLHSFRSGVYYNSSALERQSGRQIGTPAALQSTLHQ